MVQVQRKKHLNDLKICRLRQVIKANKLTQFQQTQKNAFINLVVSTIQLQDINIQTPLSLPVSKFLKSTTFHTPKSDTTSHKTLKYK